MSERTVLVDRWDEQVEIRVPGSAIVIQAAPRADYPALEDPEGAIREAICSPLGMPPLGELVGGNSSVAVAFDDPLKYGPKYLSVPILIEELERAGVKRGNITLVSANGTHDRPPKEDFKGFYRGLYPVLPDAIVEEFWPDRFINHDANDPGGLVDMGVSRLGDLVEHNRVLVDSDLTIYTGSVFPLIWGGYSGEGVVIGLASARSIYSHHRFSVIGAADSVHSDPRTQGYRRHKDAVMDRIEEFLGKKVFYVNGVSDPVGNWAGFFAGHYKGIQEPQWACADRQHLHGVPQVDILVAGLPRYVWYSDTRNPIINIVAATTILRSWRNKPLLKKGGVLILVSKCDGHIDPAKHASYARALELYRGAGSAAALEERYFEKLFTDGALTSKYQHENAYHPVHPIWLFNENQYALDHAGKIIIATGENADAPALVGAEYAATFEDAMRQAKELTGPDPRILVLPNFFSFAPMTFLVE
jgi:nickel-dependent lactate racemase